MLASLANAPRTLARGFAFVLVSTAALALAASAETAKTKQAKAKVYEMPPAATAGAKSVAKGIGGGALVIAQTVDGALEQTDEVFTNDGTFFDLWSFEGKAGDIAVVRMAATDYVPCAALFLSGPLPTSIGSACEDATILVPLPKTGTYLVAANAANPGDVGAYKLRVDVLPGL